MASSKRRNESLERTTLLQSAGIRFLVGTSKKMPLKQLNRDMSVMLYRRDASAEVGFDNNIGDQ
jgi:hypothetical protein